MSSGCSVAVGRDAAAQGDGKHHGARRQHASSTVEDELRLANRRVAEAEEVPDLVRRDRLQIESAGLPGRCRGPREMRVEEDVRLDDRRR